MKKILLLLLLVTYSNTNAQRIKTILYLKAGDSISGYSKGIDDSFIKFGKEKKSKYILRDIEGIDKVILYDKEGKKEYHHIYVKKKKKVIELFAKLISKGEINHYIYSRNIRADFTINKHLNKENDFFNFPRNNNTDYESSVFYLKKKKDKYTTYISDVDYSIFGEKIFRKNAISFFRDCPKLVKGIKAKEFKKSDIIEIIEFYNTACN